MMKYNGYIGSVEVDVEENTLFGKLLYIKDLVNYEADSPADLKIAFEGAVDDYLTDCLDQGVEPDVPFKGQFNVRISPNLHRELAVTARTKNKSLNDYVGHVLTCHAGIDAHGHINNWLTQSFVLHAVLNHRGPLMTVGNTPKKGVAVKRSGWQQMEETNVA